MLRNRFTSVRLPSVIPEASQSTTSAPRIPLTLQQARVRRDPISVHVDFQTSVPLSIDPGWLDNQCKGLSQRELSLIEHAITTLQTGRMIDPNYDDNDHMGDFQFREPFEAADHVIYQRDDNNFICHIAVKGAQPVSGEDAPTLAEIGHPDSSGSASRHASPPRQDATKRPLSSSSASSEADTGKRQRVGSRSPEAGATSGAGSSRPPTPTATAMAGRLHRQLSRSLSGAAASPASGSAPSPVAAQTAPSASYNDVKPCQAARDALAVMAEPKTAAKLYAALVPSAAGTEPRAFNEWNTFLQNYGGIEEALQSFSAYVGIQQDFRSHQRSARSLVLSNLLRNACFPDLPCRSRARAAMTPDEWTALPQQTKLQYDHLDAALALKGLHIDNLLADTKTATRNFITEKIALCNDEPKNNTLKSALRLWRSNGFSLTLDKTLPSMIDAMTLKKSTKEAIKRVVGDISEYAHLNGLEDEQFIKQLQAASSDPNASIRKRLGDWVGNSRNINTFISNM